jgi:hypothetical protein
MHYRILHYKYRRQTLLMTYLKISFGHFRTINTTVFTEDKLNKSNGNNRKPNNIGFSYTNQQRNRKKTKK